MGKIGVLLALLGLLAGGGAWNYQRNLAAEARVNRPFKGYEDADLEAMTKAYRQEIKQYQKAWEGAAGQRRQASGRGYIGDRAREFERIQESGTKVRALKRELAERQATLGELEAEAGYRASERDKLKLFLRRLTTI